MSQNSLYICKDDEKECTLLTCNTSKSECTKKLCNKKSGVCSLKALPDCEYNKECKKTLDKYSWTNERHNHDRVKCDPTNKICKIQNDNWYDTYTNCRYEEKCAEKNEIVREYLKDDNCKIYKCIMASDNPSIEASCLYKNCNKDCKKCGPFLPCDKVSDGCSDSSKMSEQEKKDDIALITAETIKLEKETQMKWIYISIGVISIFIIIGIIIFFTRRNSSSKRSTNNNIPPMQFQPQQPQYNNMSNTRRY
jgi:hypothetical protein